MRRGIPVVLAGFLCVTLVGSIATPAAAKEIPEGEDITDRCTLTATCNEQALPHLCDGSVDTVWKGSKDDSLTIESPEPIGGLYILWDRGPTAFTLKSRWKGREAGLLDGGTDGFLHEYVPVDTAERSLTLSFRGDQPAIAQIHVLSPGEPPSWVQRWKPMLDKADMLVYSTHADDEHLWLGGTMPVYAGERGKKVQVAYMIRHGAARNEYMRNHELLDGLWTVGITNYPMISSFEDHFSNSLEKALTIYDEEEIVAYTVMLLRRFKPDVVIGQDIHGEYGHGAHRLSAYAMQKALAVSGDSSLYSSSADQFGVWNVRKCYFHLYPYNRVVMDWNQPLSAFDGRTGLEMAKAGYQCHKSQLSKWFRVEAEGSRYDCRKFGLYYSSVGPDTEKNDFFEHITPGMSPGPLGTTAGPPVTTTVSSTPPTTDPPSSIGSETPSNSTTTTRATTTTRTTRPVTTTTATTVTTTTTTSATTSTTHMTVPTTSTAPVGDDAAA